MSTEISPSLKVETLEFPSGTPTYPAISFASFILALPENILILFPRVSILFILHLRDQIGYLLSVQPLIIRIYTALHKNSVLHHAAPAYRLPPDLKRPVKIRLQIQAYYIISRRSASIETSRKPGAACLNKH
jgi:hypothetical protein